MATLAIPAAESVVFHPTPEPEIGSIVAEAETSAASPSTASFVYDRKAVERGIPLEALSSFVAESGLPMKDVLEAVIPLRTLKHRRARGEALTLDESDKLARVVRIYFFALDVFGNPEKARTFLLKPKQQFEGSTPLNLLRTDFGGREVEGMLWGIADGVFV